MKLNLIYYKCILDLAIEEFASQYGDFFKKDCEKYVLGLNASKSKLYQIVCMCIDKSINALTVDSSRDDVYLVIGSCYPKDNLLLDFKDESYFPKKLSALIVDKPALKWLLVENDIEIDIDLFNEMFVNAFNDKFSKREPKRSRATCPRIIYVTHMRLDCYMLFKTIKWAYGSSNCCNVWKERLDSKKPNLIALNDLLSKYIHNKSRMNKSKEFKRCALEVKDYLDEKLGLKG